MELTFSAVCDHAYVGDGGKFFLLGEFRYIAVKQFPARHREMCLAFRVEAMKVEGYTHALKIDLVDADARSILPQPLEGPIEFKDAGAAAVTKIWAQGILQIGGIQFPHSGDYSFSVWIDGHFVGAIPLHLFQRPQPEGI